MDLMDQDIRKSKMLAQVFKEKEARIKV